jgi:hypothetical protein
VIVPVGLLALGATFASGTLAGVLAKFLSLLTAILLNCVERFSRVQWPSYGIPGPPAWLDVAFLFGLIALAMASRAAARRLRDRTYDPQPASVPLGHQSRPECGSNAAQLPRSPCWRC